MKETLPRNAEEYLSWLEVERGRSPRTLTAYRRDLRARRENFFWQQATTANTIESYNDYLREFPQGKYAAQARVKIQSLVQPVLNVK